MQHVESHVKCADRHLPNTWMNAVLQWQMCSTRQDFLYRCKHNPKQNLFLGPVTWQYKLILNVEAMLLLFSKIMNKILKIIFVVNVKSLSQPINYWFKLFKFFYEIISKGCNLLNHFSWHHRCTRQIIVDNSVLYVRV